MLSDTVLVGEHALCSSDLAADLSTNLALIVVGGFKVFSVVPEQL